LFRLVQSLRVGSLEEECFQGAPESWRGTHQLEFCWQPIPCLRFSDGERPLTEFQTGPGDDIIVVRHNTSNTTTPDSSNCLVAAVSMVTVVNFVCVCVN